MTPLWFSLCLSLYYFLLHSDESGGNEYGLTNVSSKGRVSITVVPPRQHASRSRSRTPFEQNRSASRTRYVDISSSSSTGLSDDQRGQQTSEGAAGRQSLREIFYREKLKKEGDWGMALCVLSLWYPPVAKGEGVTPACMS